MDASLKKILRGISLELRHELEGWHDKKTGVWNAGDLERRLNEIGVWSDRPSKPLDEMPHLAAEDKAARRLVDGYLELRAEAGVERATAVAEFVRESAYTWANRLFALRCMEARGIIDEVILQKAAYAGRSLVHQRYLRKNPDAAEGEDDGLFAVLFAEFAVRSQELPALFDPKSPAVALRPSVAALKRCVALLSGTDTVRGQDPATDEVFAAPDAFGWAYQYWNADEKDRVFEMLRTKKGSKIQGADIIPATQLYTEPYMVKFLVQNSLGALWMGMYPDSKLCERWEYFVKDADRPSVTQKPVREITFLDPAEGSGHFHLEAFDLFYAMYEEEAAGEGQTITPRKICASILNDNLYGIDIDGRSVQIATAALWMKAKERAPDLEAGDLTSFHEHLVATNIRLPKERNHLEFFLQKHPEDAQLRPALEAVFQGLEHADELGTLLQIEELVDAVLRRLKAEADKSKGSAVQTRLFEPTLVQRTLPVAVEDYDKWKRGALSRLQSHFEAEAQAADAVQAFFGESASRSLSFFALLARHYDVVAANPPYMGSKNMSEPVKRFVREHYEPGKRDLYSAFILRGLALLNTDGCLAMITMNKWLQARAYSQLRCGRVLSPGGEETGDTHELNLLRNNTVFGLADLGSQAFDPENKFHDGVQVAMFLVRRHPPAAEARILVADCRAGRGPDAKRDQLLRMVQASSLLNIGQSRFGLLPGSPVIYELSDSVLQRLSKAPLLARLARVRQGICTTNDPRFIRMHWEVRIGSRWVAFAKGGGHRRWDGLRLFCVDWGCDGRRIKEFITDTPHAIHWSGRMPEPDYFFKEGWGFSRIAFGCLGLRHFSATDLFSDTNPIILFRAAISPADSDGYAGLLNSPITTFLLRAYTQSNDFREGYLRRLPFVEPLQEHLHLSSSIVKAALQHARMLVSADLIEASFQPSHGHMASIRALAAHETAERLKHELSVCVAESLLHELACLQWNLTSEEKSSVERELDVRRRIGPLSSETPADIKSLLDASRQFIPADRLDGLSDSKVEDHAAAARRFYDSAALDALSDSLEEEESTDEDEVEIGSPLPPFGDVDKFASVLGIGLAQACDVLQRAALDGVLGEERLRKFGQNKLSECVLRILGHRWPKQFEAGDALPAWSDQDGIIPLTSGGRETPLLDRVNERLSEEFPGGNVTSLEHEFEQIVGVPLEKWLAGPFFERHISQFKKRPIAWQLETVASQAAVQSGKGKKKRARAGKPVFACLLYYHKLDADLLPKVRTQYVGPLREGFEAEHRILERLTNPTADQQTRRLQLEGWVDELQAFDRLLEDVSLRGFGPEVLRPALRQYAINDALLSLTSAWLRRLAEQVASGPRNGWLDAATKTELHSDLPKWVQDSLSHLNHFCAVLGPKPPPEESFDADPTSKELAPLVAAQSRAMVEGALRLGCDRWWRPLDEAVFEPLRQEIKTAKAEIERIDEELETEGLPFQRRNELGERKHELKQKVKSLKDDLDEKSDRAQKVRVKIEQWTCPEAETWDEWLSAQPLFDDVASLDGHRPPPQSIADFITQESRYAPDINDGVRVNIAPIQKAGLLHADVLDAKDADKALADRAEWRADERRWVREGKLPQPGWWAANETEAHS